MTTIDVLEYRDECLPLLQLGFNMRPVVQTELKNMRLGWQVAWFNVVRAVGYIQVGALALADCAAWETHVLNAQSRTPRKPPRKPRWARKNAPPKASRFSRDDREAFLVAVLQWLDTVRYMIEANPGECYPHMPKSMQEVLKRNGFDPHHHRGPGRLLRHFVR